MNTHKNACPYDRARNCSRFRHSRKTVALDATRRPACCKSQVNFGTGIHLMFMACSGRKGYVIFIMYSLSHLGRSLLCAVWSKIFLWRESRNGCIRSVILFASATWTSDRHLVSQTTESLMEISALSGSSIQCAAQLTCDAR